MQSFAAAAARGRQQAHEVATGEQEGEVDKVDSDAFGTYEEQINKYSIITGTPQTVIPKIRHVLEELRPGNIFFWDGDGAMNHEDAMRSLKLFGEEVIPAVREMAKDLDLKGAFDVDTQTGAPLLGG